MAPNPKVTAAYKAMAGLGVPESKVKSVLRRLLKVYDKNWAPIEEDNYRVLADAIFEEDDNMVPEKKKKTKKVDEEELEDEVVQSHVESAQPLKRLRLTSQESQSLQPLTAPMQKKPRLEDDTLLRGRSRQQPQNALPSDGNPRVEARPVPPRDGTVDKGKQPASSQVLHRGRRLTPETASQTVQLGKSHPNNQMSSNYALIVPKDEPVDELPDYEVPIAVIHPEPSSLRPRDRLMKNGMAGKQVGHVNVTAGSSQHRDGVRDEDFLPSLNKEATSNLEVSSSTLGEIKLSMSCNSALLGPEFCMPSRDQLLSKMEDKCLHTYKITDPNFSVVKLLKDLCDCVLEFKTDSNDNSQEPSVLRSSVDSLKESEAHDTASVGVNGDANIVPRSLNGLIVENSTPPLVSPQSPLSTAHLNGLDDALLVSKMHNTNDILPSAIRKDLEDHRSPDSLSFVVVPQHQLTADDIRSFHDINDLTKGEEKVQISWENKTTNDFPPSFQYIPQSLVFQDAHVKISLSRIGVEDCCSTCMGNCVLASTPCACANKSGGEFAYTSDGLLKEEFLEACVGISRNPQQHYFYCQNCPVERSKNDGCLEPCKGHVKRKFIKECWTKCGCGKFCGNRVIQRGISSNLQVFFNLEGKGWGLRTLQDLPKGAFVCEFVGEILTMKELHERKMKCTENGKYTYPVLLDADWDSGFVKDEEALCLDAASFGNIARFINHRCFDANLVEIPVEVEYPDHSYYHYAFFTSRAVAALEELTWDYGIDFDDHDDLVKLFQCRCGSKFCRNMKRSNRSLRTAPTA